MHRAEESVKMGKGKIRVIVLGWTVGVAINKGGGRSRAPRQFVGSRARALLRSFVIHARAARTRSAVAFAVTRSSLSRCINE